MRNVESTYATSIPPLIRSKEQLLQSSDTCFIVACHHATRTDQQAAVKNVLIPQGTNTLVKAQVKCV